MKRRSKREERNSTGGSRARRGSQTIVSYSVGALPILQRILDQSGIGGALEEHLRADKRYRVPPATAVRILILNYLCSREPLYGVKEWGEQYAPDLLGLEERQLDSLNDDRMARTLDLVFQCDHRALVLAAVGSVIEKYGISLEELHNDSTTIRFFGSYEKASEETVFRGRTIPAITWGFSKDHRPDLKQLLYTLTISADGAVPLFFSTDSGNLTDDKTHRRTWDILREIAGGPDFIYVADSKLATRANMEYIDRRGGRFISVLPRSRRECKQFVKELIQTKIEWEEILRREGEEDQEDDVVSVLPSERATEEGYRLIWYFSTRKRELDRVARQNRIERALNALADLRECLISPRSRIQQEGRVHDAVRKCLTEHEAQDLVRVRVYQVEIEDYRQDGPGRPGKNTRYVRKTKTRYDIVYDVDEEKVAEQARLDGTFPLVTNDRALTAQELLEIYRRQPLIEKRFAQLKTDFQVAPVYLKKATRVVGLLCVYFFALLVQALLERELRRGMEAQGQQSLPLYPEGRPCKAPTARRVIDVFEKIQRHVLHAARGHETFLTELAPLQRQVLELLGISPSTYGRPRT